MAATPRGWVLHDNKVYVRLGKANSNDVAAFDFDNTFIRSDSGLIFMRTADDWVPTANYSDMIEFIKSLVEDNWTFAIFNNSLETNPEFTQNVLFRINEFISRIQHFVADFEPYVFVSIRQDVYRKPDIGMWELFRQMTGITEPRPSSFYCGDASGPTAADPLYRWSDEDSQFARNIGLTFYTPDEMIGTYKVGHIANTPLIIMAAHPSQYTDFVNDLIEKNPSYTISTLKDARAVIRSGRIPIITGERLATRAGRNRLKPFLPKGIHPHILLFTRPIHPYITREEYARDDAAIRGYANALDYHIKFSEIDNEDSFTICRIN
jgi:DNA 3'-phosphatase